MADHLQTIKECLDGLLESKNDALPSGFNKVRFLQNSMSYLADTVKDDQKYDAEVIAKLLFKGAVLGLDFLNKECHIITNGSKITFQTDYKGEKKLVKKHSIRPVLDIYAKNVREGDAFDEEIEDGKPTITFHPLTFNNSPIVGSFAVALFEDGGMVYEVMSTEEIESVRKFYGREETRDTWDKSQGEMYKRTVMRRLCKSIELNMDTDQQIAFEDGGGFDFKRENRRPVQRSPLEKMTATEDGAEVLADAQTNQG